MLSYKDWKNLNESVLGGTNLGLVSTPQVGMIGNSQTQTEEDIDLVLAEMKKKMAALKKKMGVGGIDDEDEDDTEGDEEVVKDKGGEMVKPSEPKDTDADAGDEEPADDEDDDDEDEDTAGDAREFMKKGGKKKLEDKPKGDLMKDFKKGDGLKVKHKGKEKGKEAGVAAAAEPQKKSDTSAKHGGVVKKKRDGDLPSQDEWLKSVNGMLDIGDVNKKYGDGMPASWDDGLPHAEPQPGEVGYAPVGRIN